MKRVLPLLLIVPLALACKKPAPAATTTAPGSAATPAAAAAAKQAQPGVPGAPPAPGQPAAKPVPAQLPSVVAKVNGEPIEAAELENAVAGLEARAGHPVPPEQRNEVFRDVLNQLVDYHALAAEAHARKLDVTDAEVQARIEQMKHGFANEQAFQQAMAQQHVTIDQLTKQARMGMSVDKLVDAEISSKISVQDADVNTFYQQNLERFKQGESVHASHILITVPQNATADQKKQARTKAEQILKQLKGGADFGKLAREQSQDPGSAPQGGDLGFFPKGQMEPSFEAAAFGLKPGALSGVVETPFGYHIIKVIEKKPPHTAPLQEVGPQIKQFLTEQQKETKLTALVEQVKSKMKIDILI